MIRPVVEQAGLHPYRIDKDDAADILIGHIEDKIKESRLCIADITTDNPNVWYEVGYVIASGKDIILMCCANERTSDYPFDVRHRNLLIYQSESLSDFNSASEQLTKRINAILLKTANILHKSELDSFYTATIVENRLVPDKNGKSYHCYKLNGLIEDVEQPIQGENHWILYDKSRFNSLSVNDKIKFKVEGYTEIKSYNGAEKVRNIYLSDLIKLS